VTKVDYAIEIDQCYGQSNLTLCLEFPSPLTITDVLITNVTGTTSSKYQPQIATFACSSDDVCSNIVVENINVLSPNGTHEAYCLNMDETTLDVECVTVSKGFN
jgi:galacturan 1,4-alpha-galacturonidase